MIRKSNSLSKRKLAEECGVSRPQIDNLLAKKERLLAVYEQSLSVNAKHPRTLASIEAGIDSGNWEWFRSVRGKGLPVNGNMIQEKAKAVAETNGYPTEFKVGIHIALRIGKFELTGLVR